MTIERRYLPQQTANVRAAGEGKTISGYAAVFYREGAPETEYRLWDDLVERIMPGAFSRALAEQHDARALFNHDPDNLLGRVSSGTCRLSIDGTGLAYSIDPPDTQCGRDTVTSIDRGDLSGSSFAFIPRKVTWMEVDDLLIRQIEDVDLLDVGPVTYPAYEGTSAMMRSDDRSAIEQEAKAFRESLVRPRSSVAVDVDFRYRQIQEIEAA